MRLTVLRSATLLVTWLTLPLTATTFAQTDERDGQRVAPREAIEIAQRVAAYQATMDKVTADFELYFVLRTGEEITATYRWARTRDSERLETHFCDVPLWARLHGLDDELIVSTPERIVELFTRTNQALIMEPRQPIPIVWMPLDFLRPATRRSFAELLDQGAKFVGFRRAPDLIELQFATPEAPTRRISAQVEIRGDSYLVTGWTFEGCNSAFSIEYEQACDGQWFPSIATFDSETAPVVRRAVMTTTRVSLRQPPAAEFAVQFRPGMIVGDTRFQDENGNSLGYSVDAAGNLVRVQVVGGAMRAETSTATTLGAGAASAGLILAVMIGWQLHRRRQRA